jgi:hypothetical protein
VGDGSGLAVPDVGETLDEPAVPGAAGAPGEAVTLGEALAPGDGFAPGDPVPDRVGTGLSVTLATAVRLGSGLGETVFGLFATGVDGTPPAGSELEWFPAIKPMTTPQRRMSRPCIIDEIRGDHTHITPPQSVSSDICRCAVCENFWSKKRRRLTACDQAAPIPLFWV